MKHTEGNVGLRIWMMTLLHAMIHGFIILSLWIMIGANLVLPPVQFFSEKFPPSTSRHLIARLNWHILYADWMVKRAGWLAGVSSPWLMFSRMDRTNWYLSFTGADRHGRETTLFEPDGLAEPFSLSSVEDFREAKIQHNLYGSSAWRAAFADYLCQKEYARGTDIASVRVGLKYYLFQPPQEVNGEKHYTDHGASSMLGTYACPTHYQQ